jgi:hypothetical protein
MTLYYARPTDVVPERIQVLRPLVPVHPPEPQATVPPQLSVPSIHVLAGYLRTSHVIPAASCRSLTADTTLRRSANSGGKLDVEELRKGLLDAKTSYDTEEMQEKYVGKSQVPQWNYVDRYVRQSPPVDPKNPGTTLFLTHATGLHRQVRIIISGLSSDLSFLPLRPGNPPYRTLFLKHSPLVQPY